MAGDWIKMRGALWTHPKFLSLASHLSFSGDPGMLVYACGEDALGIGAVPASDRSLSEEALRHVTERALRDVTMGALLRVWCCVNEHCQVNHDDAICTPMSMFELDDVAGFRGFGEALKLVGWLVVVDDDKSLLFPNFCEFNEPVCLRRSTPKTNAERQAEYRARKAVTKSNGSNGREEKIREEKINKKEPSGSLSPADEIVSTWNATAGVAPVRKLTDARLAHLRKRLRDSSWDWRAALAKFPLAFKGSGGDWMPSFDWFVRPDTVTKILEGQFDSSYHRNAGRKLAAPQLEGFDE